MFKEKEINIKIVIGAQPGPDQPGSYARPDGDSRYTLFVDTQELDYFKAPIWMMAAHEFGHAIAREFEFPGHRGRKFFNNGPETDVAREEEAWDVAQTAFNAIRKMAVDTYRR